jgi:hypothetical protein
LSIGSKGFRSESSFPSVSDRIVTVIVIYA